MKSIFVLGLLAAALLVTAASDAQAQTASGAQQPAATSQNNSNAAPAAATQNPSNTAPGSQNPAYSTPPATPSEVATTINPRTGAGAGEPNGFVRLYGCLERGSGAEEYSLKGQGANWWELKSTSIDLGAYLDQTVMIAALPTPNPDGTLNVTALAMVQNSCTY